MKHPKANLDAQDAKGAPPLLRDKRTVEGRSEAMGRWSVSRRGNAASASYRHLKVRAPGRAAASRSKSNW